MPVTLDPITCACGRVCAFTVRGGPQHQSADARDPYTWVATAIDQEPRIPAWARLAYRVIAWAIGPRPGRRAFIAASHGVMSRAMYWSLMRQLADAGYEAMHYEHEGRETIVTQEQAQRRQHHG